MTTPQRATIVVVAVILVVAAMVGAWYAEEDYRGARAWERTRRDLEARGESLDAAHFIPPPVPDDQNLAMAPVFTRLYDYQVDPVTKLLTFSQDGSAHAAMTLSPLPYGLDGDPSKRQPAMLNWSSGHALDLAVFQQFFRSRKDFPRADAPGSAADDTLLALTRFGSLLDEVAQAAASRPLARFPVNWTQQPPAAICLPHYNFVQKLVTALRLRACASLANGRTEPSLRDVALGFRLRGSISHEPTLIAVLVDCTCCNILLQPVWEGLAARRWSAVQLGELQEALGQVDLLQSYRKQSQAGRALIMLPTADDLRRTGDLNRISMSMQGRGTEQPSPGWISVMNHLFPRGWYDEAKAVSCRLDQQYVIDPIDLNRRRFDTHAIIFGNNLIHRVRMTPETFLAIIFLPAECSAATKVAYGQTSIEQATVACALERFYLDHQSYPAGLAALVPAYLKKVPTDVIDGAPMRYHQTPGGRYRLWEVGWNGRDEGGAVVWNSDGKRLDDKLGDWVWQYEPLAPPGSPAP